MNNQEIQTIIASLQNILQGQPWYGKAVYDLLQEVNEVNVFTRPGVDSHSLADLVFHMLTWALFAQERIEGLPIADMAALDALDWRPIDPAVHHWKNALQDLKTAHNKIIELLQAKDDSFLEQKVDYRKYNFRYLLNGLIQHNIYHIGQVAYVSKWLPK